MKKIMICLAIAFVFYLSLNQKEEYYVIPDEAIRFRIIANSNSIYDQYIKIKVKNSLEESFKKDISYSNTIFDTREIIKNNLNNYRQIVKKTLLKEDYNKNFTINYGMNYFPEKIYQDVKYPAGEYESLLVTIGEGQGDNWWCVLFPPICTMEVSKNEKIQYKFFIKEIFDKYFKI